MPCCAFAAFLFSQLILAVAAVKRVVFGARAETRSQTNAAVEWRLQESGGAAAVSAPRPVLWRPRRSSMAIFTLAALIEVALLCGALYAVGMHLGHAHHETGGATSPR
jgi:hypothetical protein